MTIPGNNIVRALLGTLIAVLIASGVASAQHYTRTDLTQDAAGVSPTAPNTDANMVNAWGLARSSASPWWISDNGTGVSTLYDLAGIPQSLVVTIPPPKGVTGSSAPTGAVYNYSTSFTVAVGKPAVFLFVTEDGTISGWNPTVNPTSAVTLVDRSKVASYKGMAIAQTSFGPHLYATNFKSGQVEVFNGNLTRVRMTEHQFEDERLPRNFVPFNIQNVGGNLVVTFAHRLPGAEDEDHGPGVGYVDIFDPYGRLVQRLEHGRFLNAPWGVTLAPSDFGRFSHRLLIGNFGDGTIQAFNAVSGKFEGTLLDASTNQSLVIDGLWALGFGNNAKAGSSTELYFTSGPQDESHGLFGKLTAVATEQRGNTE